MHISVIIPAHQAADTLSETLESIRAQTFPHWEAIVVDDGSSDSTAAIATYFAVQDTRFRCISQPPLGKSMARNAGISLARYDWLLFLDADDWILPQYLERMTQVLVGDRDLDAVHCGWTRVAPDGTHLGAEYCRQEGDLFATFASRCAFAMHAAIVRRSLVQVVGGFEAALCTCEDWDLWQRIARTGARFGALREVLALYRLRPGAASLNACQLLTDGLRVLRQGHAPDRRVSLPHPAHMHRLPLDGLAQAQLSFTTWCAGLVLSDGKDASALLHQLHDDCCPMLDPQEIAATIFAAMLHAVRQPPTSWGPLWPNIAPHVDTFLAALEAHSCTPGLAVRARTHLERLILERSAEPRPSMIGTTYGVRLEVTEPIPDIVPPSDVTRLHCAVEMEGTPLGTLELPVCEGGVPGPVLADAIAAEFAWPILGRFFEHTLFPELACEHTPTGRSLYRCGLCLTAALPEDGDTFWPLAHDCIGWTVFLQEVWARPGWAQAHFYDATIIESPAPVQHGDDGWIVVEVSNDLPDVMVSGQQLHVAVTVGGVPLGLVRVPSRQHVVRAQEIRVALTCASGFELCRVCVREGLLGTPLTDPTPLRVRLATVAAAQYEGREPAPEAATDFCLTIDGVTLAVSSGPALVPGSARAIARVLQHSTPGVVVGRRTPETMGTSASRRAVLPMAVAHELVTAAATAGETAFQVRRADVQPACAVYMPELIWHATRYAAAFSGGVPRGDTSSPARATPYDRSHFETIFALQDDPWQYTSPYEQTKYTQTLALLPAGEIPRALELACAEGHFTLQLAPRVGQLVAADVSQIALERAARRCASIPNVRFVRLDLTRDALPGYFELIVCSEVLYYVGSQEMLQDIARRFTKALAPGGYLLMAHAHLVVDAPDHAGFDWALPFGAKVIGETFMLTPSLRLLKELRTPLYRIQLFQRDPRISLCPDRSTLEMITFEQQPTSLSPEVAAHVRWHGGPCQGSGATGTVVTHQLPILLYHRIAPAGSPVTRQYRVTPEAFEEQLQYLSDAGYYSVRLEDWSRAMAEKSPLPGRAVVLTFDDGYRDFLTHAWPLLKRYGFSATVFLVAEAIGRHNSWDSVYNEEVPLLDWDEIRQLRDDGVVFGSHALSHRPLTALSHAEIVREGVRSRSLLMRALGRPVTAFAYPYGEADQVVQHLIGACGYVFGLTCRQACSRLYDALLALPRIEVKGADRLHEFVAKLAV